MDTQFDRAQVQEATKVITSGHAIPVEKANAEPAPVIPKEEKSISDADSFDLVVGIGSSSYVRGIIHTRGAVNLMTFETYEELNLKGLEPRKCFVTMSNGTISICMGVVEDVPANLSEDVVMGLWLILWWLNHHK